MSAGAFVRSKYEADNGDIHPIRVQPETLLANLGEVNAAPSGDVTVALFATARKSRRSYGVGARTVRVRFTAAVPDGYEPGQILSVPILTPDAFVAAQTAQTGTYLGSAVEIVGSTSESRR